MKIAGLIITYLMGVVFFVFGIMYFLHMLPHPPMSGDMSTYAELMERTGYMKVVKVLEIIFGGMLLINFKRPLAWLLLLPIVVNIFLFEVLIAKAPGLGAVLLILNFFMVYMNRESYKGLIAGK